MEEPELRALAAAVAPHLHTLLDHDAADAVETRLVAALALPPGAAAEALIDVLSSSAALREWVRRQRDAMRDGYRLSTGPVPSAQRYLSVEFPGRASLDARVAMHVRVTRTPEEGGSVALQGFALAKPETLSISVSAGKHIQAIGPTYQDLRVPVGADSQVVMFSFKLLAPGTHVVVVRAFLDGSCLGEFRAEISVEHDVTTHSLGARTAELRQIVREPGEVTLEVAQCPDGHSFRLVCETPYPLVISRRSQVDVDTHVDRMATEIRRMAVSDHEIEDPRDIRRRLVNIGAALWNDAVPQQIREQFWAQLSNITSFSVISDLDTTPWELLYPAEHDEGRFLVERMPVVRRVTGQRHHPRQLRLDNVGYVRPKGSPPDTSAEIEAIRAKLGPNAADRGVLDRWSHVCELVDAGGFGMLHFACHNTFDRSNGSYLHLAGGAFRPRDLALAVQRRSLEAVGPLVFFNACRSAGEHRTMTAVSGWANEFMKAGAGAFVGTLWAVRSPSAKAFAVAFYDALLSGRQPLGQASMTARRAVMAEEDDPTWLAYTVYGNPAASVDLTENR